jgi:serine/threonine-protein kinase HipA
MQVTRRVMPAALTDVSRDGQALIVHRFDVDENGARLWGMEDFCALLGLRPAAKYETTWERIAKAVRDHVPAANRPDVFRHMATLLLLTYALRNADCHAKNVALRYTRRDDVHLAPAYDMITTAAYPDYARNPPGISFMGKKTWTPGKHLQIFITATFGLPAREQADIVDRISTAMAEVGPQVREAMAEHPGFVDIGKRILLAWQEGLAGLRDKRIYAMGDVDLGEAFVGFSDPGPVRQERQIIGRSDLLGRH